MSECLQELCSHWSGDGNVCPCAIDGRELPRCPDCGALHDPDVCAATSALCDCCASIAIGGRRYGQCDGTCTTDCGHCKGAGRPGPVEACGASGAVEAVVEAGGVLPARVGDETSAFDAWAVVLRNRECHRVQWTLEPESMRGRIICEGPDDAGCRYYCAEGCEGYPCEHPPTLGKTCGVEPWFADSAEYYYEGPETSAHDGPVGLVWNGDYYTWHYAEPVPTAVPTAREGETWVRFYFSDADPVAECECGWRTSGDAAVDAFRAWWKHRASRHPEAS